jgi:hypothetical protein
MAMEIGYIFLGLLAVLNLVVMVGVWRNPGLSGFQKFGQSILIWLLPVIGASIVLAFLGQNHTRDEMRSLVPFPFYMVGYKRREREYNEPPEGVCG